MISIVKYCIKIILFYIIILGISLTFVNLTLGKEIIIWKLLFCGFLTGIILCFIQLLILLQRLKKLGINKFNKDTFKVHQKKIIEIEISKTDLINKLRTDVKTGKMVLEVKDNTILLKSGSENIQIQINELEQGLKQIMISSKPDWFLFLDLWNNGKNLENVLYLENLIKKPV